MQIYGRDVPGAEDIWRLFGEIAQTREIWNAATFKAAAAKCGLRKIAARHGYFAFSGKLPIVGQAPVVDDAIEEIRLFIGQEPKDLSEALFNKDRRKGGQLATEYAARFRQELGAPRMANGNEIFESGDHRVRVMAAECVWVVISSLSVLKRLPNDWWAPDSG